MKRWLTIAALAAALGCAFWPAAADNKVCPTQPPGDNSNNCASTAFVLNAVGGATVVNTFNGRSGTVVPQSGDYNFNQLSGTAGLSQGGLGGSQSGATANQVPVYPGSGGAATPTSLGGSGGLFDSICSSTVGQAWVRITSGWGCTALGFVNPMWLGAVGDGNTDDSTAFASAVTLAVSSKVGKVWVPARNFCLFSGVTLINGDDWVEIAGAGLTFLNACNNDTVVVRFGNGGATLGGVVLRNLQVIGMNSPTATAPAILFNNCVFCTIDHVFASGGERVLFVEGSSTYNIYTSSVGGAYGAAEFIVQGAGGGWSFRTAFDASYPNGSPNNIPFTLSNWAATTAIGNTHVVQTSSGWILQAMSGGTTGSTQPKITANFTGTISGGTTLTVSGVTGDGLQIGQHCFGPGTSQAPWTTITGGSGTTWTISPSQGNIGPEAMSCGFSFGTNITDGSVTWQLAANTTHDSVRYDTGTSQTFEWGTDHSGPFRYAINVLNSQAGTSPSLISFTDTVGTGMQAVAIFQASAHILMENSQIQNCQQASCFGIEFASNFGGFATIHGNDITGSVNGISFVGPTGPAYATVDDNVVSASNIAINISSGVTHFVIGNNICSTSPTGIQDSSGAVTKLVQASCP